MLDVIAEWNQPCRGLAGATTLYLGLRIRPRAAGGEVPVHVLVLLDVSTSMDGPKLNNAKRAVQTVWDQLRPGDRLSLVTFSTRVTPVLEWSEKGRADEAEVLRAISQCQVEGVTLLSSGLGQAIERAGQAPADDPRFIWIVTDGHPTNARGRLVQAVEPYLEAASQGAARGLTIGALGLGDAADYRYQFLRDLADHGQGRFLYTPDPSRLSEELAEQLANAKAVTATQGRVRVELEPGSNLLSAARVIPDYMPFDLPEGRGTWSLPIGPISAPETIVVLEVANAVFGASEGVREVGQVVVSANVSGQTETTPPTPVRLELCRAGARKIYARNQLMENMRVAMLMGRNAQLRADSDDPEQKLRATEDMADLARATGDLRQAAQLDAEARQLRQSGALSPDQEARAEIDGRRTGAVLFKK